MKSVLAPDGEPIPSEPRKPGDTRDGEEIPSMDRVVFLDGDKLDSLAFPRDAVTLMLINVEEERQLRPPDLFVRRSHEAVDAGASGIGQPDIRLFLHLLFVARFRQYNVAWDHLAAVIQRLQTHRVFDRAKEPELPDGVDKLVFELLTLDFTQQYQVWNALRVTNQPSILYRARLITFRNPTLEELPPPVREAPQRRVAKIKPAE